MTLLSQTHHAYDNPRRRNGSDSTTGPLRPDPPPGRGVAIAGIVDEVAPNPLTT